MTTAFWAKSASVGDGWICPSTELRVGIIQDEDELVAYDEFDEQESNAAVKIQAGARGMIARNRVKALRDVKHKREASGRTEGGAPAKEEV
jgi:hypothetical protein